MYKILAADQKEYGPVAFEQMRDWIVQGRASAHTLVSLDGGAWKPLATFSELAALLHLAPPPAVPPPVATSSSSQARANSMAITGLVFSILGLTCCPLLGTVLGLTFSAIGLSQIQKEPQAYSTGKVVPILGIVIALLGVIVSILGFMTGTFTAILRELPR